MGVNITGIGIANGIGFKSYYKFNNPINPDYDAILLESSSYILLEDGDFILLENTIDPKTIILELGDKLLLENTNELTLE